MCRQVGKEESGSKKRHVLATAHDSNREYGAMRAQTAHGSQRQYIQAALLPPRGSRCRGVRAAHVAALGLG